MPHPVATIRLTFGTEYNGIYTYQGAKYIDYRHSYEQFRLQTGVLGDLRNSGKVRFLQLRRVGRGGQFSYLNHEEDLARAAVTYHRSQAERYQQAQRQQAPNGDWYLSPRAFEEFVGIGATTRDTWRKHGVPILDGEMLDLLNFPDGNDEPTPFYSERQAKRIVEARAATDDALVPARVAAQKCRVYIRLVTKLAHDGVIEAELRSTRIGSRTFKSWCVSVSDLRQELQRRKQAKKRPQEIPDPVSVEEAAQRARVHPATVNRWIRQGKIRHENLGNEHHGGRRFVVSRREVLAHVADQQKLRDPGGADEWLYKRQAHQQFPDLGDKALRYYRKHTVPPLGRKLRVRSISRPRGMKGRWSDVLQYWSADLRALSEWFQTRANGSARVDTESTAMMPTVAPKRRGPRILNQTLKIGKHCYEQLSKNVLRRIICREIWERFNRSMSESDVTTYARRYARNPDNPRPWPPPRELVTP